MSEKMKVEDKKCMTPKFRAAFANVFEPKAFEQQEPKFSIVMLFPKNQDLTSLKKAAFNAAVEKFGPKEKWPKNMRLPFRDGNEKTDLDGYADHIFVSASTKQRPGVVDQKLAPITKEDQTFYSGCFARATLIAFAYDKVGNKGVSFSLQNVQKLEDGEPFSGRRKAEDEFDAVADGSDDAGSYPVSSTSDLGF